MAIIEVVKYNGGPNELVWKYPNEELGTWTQLIVNQTQEAILVKGGRRLGLFGPGRHTLTTENIPILKELIKIPFGGRSPFTAEVWFINKAHHLDIRWGTPSPVQLQDPKFGIMAPVRANGVFGIRVTDSAVLYDKLIGTTPGLNEDALIRYFRGLYITKIKDTISSYLVEKQIGILEINAHIAELSEHIRDEIQSAFAEYGTALVSFFVNEVSVPEDDDGVQQLKTALAKRAEMNLLGYTYQQQRMFDTMEGAAKNEGSGAPPFLGAGMGLAMGGEMGRILGQGMSGLTQPQTEAGTKCPSCGASVTERAKFCSECGKPLGGKFCPGCGARLNGAPKFCPECGQKIE